LPDRLSLLAALPLSAVLGLDKIMCHGCNKRDSTLRNRHVALKNRLEGLRLPKVEFGVLGVLAYAGAVQADAGKTPLLRE
jgi:hypothetical protein